MFQTTNQMMKPTINGHFRDRWISGTHQIQALYRAYIIFPQNIFLLYLIMVQYLQFKILKFPLIQVYNFMELQRLYGH